jgi:hypothetical protein
MEQELSGHKTRHVIIINKLYYGARQCTRLIPHLKRCCNAGIRFNKAVTVPLVRKSSLIIGGELKKIHHKENWVKRCGTTLIDNAAGLGMAMLAAKVVENMVEVRQFGNLWGLLSTRPVVSESTFEILSFSVEFIIALITFTITEHYIGEYRQRKNSDTSSETMLSEQLENQG